jgi:molybdate transport system substrate-binding protein
VKRLALADPQVVPAGIYARQHLEELGLWIAVKPKVVPTDNVRAVLAAVESGNVEAGIVYKTDARISKRIKVAQEIPIAEGPVISYPAAMIEDSMRPEAAKRFLQHLDSDDARRTFERFGFIVRK